MFFVGIVFCKKIQTLFRGLLTDFLLDNQAYK